MSLYGNIPRYIKLNLVQSLLEEVKEKEYFVADKMKGSNLKILDLVKWETTLQIKSIINAAVI